MTKASDNNFAKIKLAEGTAWATPSSGYGVMYAKSADSLLYYKNDAGTEYTLSQTAGGGGSVVFYDEGVAAGTAAILNVVGSSGTVAVASGTATLTLTATSVPGWLGWFVGTTDSTNFYWDGNDLAGFTEQTVSGTTTWVESGNAILASATNQTADNASTQLIAKTISTGDQWMLAVNSTFLGSDVANSTTANRGIGIVMTDGTATTSNCVIGHLQVDNNSANDSMVLVGRHGTLTNVNSGAPWVSQLQVAYGGWLFVRLKYSASNTFQLAFGPSPYQVSAFGEADISKTMTPTHIGLFINEFQAGTALGMFGPLKKV